MRESDISLKKSILRKSIRTKLAAMSPNERTEESEAICSHLSNELLARRPLTILSFAAMPIEPMLLSLIDPFLKQGHRMAFPRVVDVKSGEMHLHEVTDIDSLVVNAMGIPEPAPGVHPTVLPEEIDVALVPAWAFDPATGARLGKGGGFYDRLLAGDSWRAETIGIAFRYQLVDQVPEDAHDQRVQRIVTAEGMIELDQSSD